MTMIFVNQLLTLSEGAGECTYRILYIDRDRLSLFDVDDRSALPGWRPLEEISGALMSGHARVADRHSLDPDYCPDDLLTPASRQVRDRRLDVILPLVTPLEEGPPPTLSRNGRGLAIAGAMARWSVSRDKVYAWLRLWWRHGQIDNALLPKFKNCGRSPASTFGRKRGRPLSVGKRSAEHVGMNVDAATKALIIRGAKRFYGSRAPENRGTARGAYQATLEHFFYRRLDLRDGVLTPIILEKPEDRNFIPSFGQWKYHVDEFLLTDGRLEQQYSEREWALKHRPVLGSSRTQSSGPGQLFLVDATVADVYLVSEFDRRWVIGRPILYLVVDHFSRMVVGLHVALEGPNWTGAMMALANAFSSKVQFCKEHGIAITHENWPADVAPAQLTADRGEVLSRHADYIVPGFRMVIQDTPPFRADFKAFVEGQFKVTNERVLKRLPGYVDKSRDRGDPDYRYDASLTVREFTAAMIRLALNNNCNRPIVSNLPLEFPLEPEGSPVPMELWNWGLINATPSIRRFSLHDVRRNLLPTHEAITSRNGLSVFGGRIHYTLPRAITECWFARAPNRGGRKVSVAIDPWDVSVAFLRNTDGTLERCELVPAEIDRFAGRSLSDVEDYFERQKMRESADQQKRIQSDADLHAHVDAIKDQAATARRRDLNAADLARPAIKSISSARSAELDIARTQHASSNSLGGSSPLGPPDHRSGCDDEYTPMPD